MGFLGAAYNECAIGLSDAVVTVIAVKPQAQQPDNFWFWFRSCFHVSPPVEMAWVNSGLYIRTSPAVNDISRCALIRCNPGRQVL